MSLETWRKRRLRTGKLRVCNRAHALGEPAEIRLEARRRHINREESAPNGMPEVTCAPEVRPGLGIIRHLKETDDTEVAFRGNADHRDIAVAG